MKKFIALSLVLHLCLYAFFVHHTEPAKQGLELTSKEVISVSFVVPDAKPSPNPGSLNVAEKKMEKKKDSINQKVKQKHKKKEKKKKKQEKTVEKKAFESKMATKDAKVVEEASSPAVEEAKGEEVKDSKEAEGAGNPFYGSNFQANGDGSYTALSSSGIHYEILREVEPDYPSQAESISYGKVVKVKVKFLVGLDGRVEKINFLKSHKKLGFDREVKKAVQKWKFKPIVYAGQGIKVYFIKEFVFNPR